MIKQMRCVKIIGATMVLSIIGVVKVVQDACALVVYALVSYGKIGRASCRERVSSPV